MLNDTWERGVGNNDEDGDCHDVHEKLQPMQWSMASWIRVLTNEPLTMKLTIIEVLLTSLPTLAAKYDDDDDGDWKLHEESIPINVRVSVCTGGPSEKRRGG